MDKDHSDCEEMKLEEEEEEDDEDEEYEEYEDEESVSPKKRRKLMSEFGFDEEVDLDLSIEEKKCGPGCREPLDYFRLFFSDQLTETMVEQCNRYARVNFDKGRVAKTSMWASWRDVTVKEFNAFVGVILNMGVRPHPSLQDFFSTSFAAYSPFFRAMFKRERFLQIYIIIKKIVYNGNKKQKVKLNIEVNHNAPTDQYLLTTDCFLKETANWWQKPFFWGLKIAVKYGYILYKKKEKRPNVLPYLQFVDKLILQLIGDFRGGTSKIQAGHTPDREQRLNGALHVIMPASEKKLRECTVCSTKNNRKRTLYYCTTCDAKPTLHVGVCFQKYHTLKDYREDSVSK